MTTSNNNNNNPNSSPTTIVPTNHPSHPNVSSSSSQPTMNHSIHSSTGPKSQTPHKSHHPHTHHHTFLPPHSYMIQQQEPTSLKDKTLLEKKQVKRLRWIDFISGSLAAIVSDTLLQPLDTVKTRQQFVGEVVAGQTSHRFVYKNVFDAFWTIARQEGVRGLFRGWVPTMFGSLPAGAIYFGTYESMKRFSMQHSEYLREHKHFAYMLSGSIAEFMGSLVFVPSELIKCRFQTNTLPQSQLEQATWKTFYQVAKVEGVTGLFRGYSATMVRDIPYSMTQFLLYELLKKAVLKRKKQAMKQSEIIQTQNGGEYLLKTIPTKVKLSVMESILVGGTAGGVAACLSNPIDVVKTRLQTSMSFRGGFLSMFRHVMQQEGWRGFFKGVTPRVMWVTFSTAIMFSVFEFVSHALTERFVDEDNVTEEDSKSDDSTKEKRGFSSSRVLMENVNAASSNDSLK
ncbi:hypothetical protein C9374_012599 [Naegleria lovaniensis]|uniref:Mitochondrial carrier protein n=1 Tax=Naegleria lovaniensis TaxID=51637 RepID=A0AA88KQH3_NAELO|nr:uncharacterized protein C9374_012599 [Naegleria lovaniensis]KAG2392347.1 hypothetical protein C9374_012599 [Naegleria lovaniensis]